MEGRSRVETVGTDKWYYNSSKGLQYPAGSKESDRKDGKVNDWSSNKVGQLKKTIDVSAQTKPGMLSLDVVKTDEVEFQMEDMENMKHISSARNVTEVDES